MSKVQFFCTWFFLLTLGLSAQDADYPQPPADYSLGAIYSKVTKSVEFRLWAPTAQTVNVSVFDKPLAPFNQSLAVLPLVKNEVTGVWTAIYGEKDPAGFFYEYRLNTGKGEKRVLDPYARSMEAFKGKGFARAAVVDLPSTDPEGGWQGAEDVKLATRTDGVIYEISVRDFTISPDSGVAENLRGTYPGFMAKIPYLKSLGVTHVQLFPVLNFMYNDETNKSYDASGKTVGTNYNWGYGPHNYFTPEGWYSTDPLDPNLRIRELKTLVRELHKAGIGVILDVVYNHFGTTTLLDDIVPDYYFRKNNQGRGSNDSFTGNDLNTSAPMVSRMIGDSLEYWTREFRVDGFRFDLMGLMDSATVLKAYDRVRAIPGKEDALFLGEGWKTYRQKPLLGGMMDQNFMTKTDTVAVFNDQLRNLLKGDANNPSPGFLMGEAVDNELLYSTLTGLMDKKYGGYTVDNPGDNIQHLAVHDGMDLRDALSWTLFEGVGTPENEREIARRVNLGHILLLTSQGIPLLHGGQEMLRTKPNPLGSTSQTHGPFVHNSFQAADNINNLIWTPDPLKARTKDFTAGMIALRKSFPVFRLSTQEKVLAAGKFIPQESPLSFSYSLKDEKANWFILANVSKSKAVFTFPVDLTQAQIFADGEISGSQPLKSLQGVLIRGTTVELEGLTGAVIRLEK